MQDPLTMWLDEMEAKRRAWEALTNATGETARLARRAAKDAFYDALPPETVQALLECVRALIRSERCYCAGEGSEAIARLRRLALGDA